MNFVYPSFLWALLALAIPLIIHLFHFRRFKTVYFTNVKFLREIKEETATRDKLKHLLVLLTRMLGIAFLVFAFAQPFLPVADQEVNREERAVSIYVDNSFSMDARSGERTLFEESKERAREIVEAYDISDRFQLLTNDFEGRHQRLLSREEFMDALQEIEISPRVKDMQQVLKRQSDALAFHGTDNKLVYILSDFQEDAVNLKNDTALQIYLLPFTGVEQRNLSLDSAWFEAPVQVLNQSTELQVNLSNYGETDIENSTLTLSINGVTKAISDFSIPAGESLRDTLQFTITETGWQEAKLELTDYPITFDDHWYMAFELAEQIPVLSINASSPNGFLNQLFGENKLFDLVNNAASNVDYASFGNYNLIILNGLNTISSGLAAELQTHMKEGGSVMLFPGLNADQGTYNTFLGEIGAASLGDLSNNTREVTSINTEHQIFKGVYESIPKNLALPKATKSYRLRQGNLSREENLLRFQDGDAFLSKYPYGRGALYLNAVPLDPAVSDYPIQGGVIVPILFKVAVVGNKGASASYTIGQDEWIALDAVLPSAESRVEVSQAGQGEFLPQIRAIGSQLRINVSENAGEAGHYSVKVAEADDLAKLALNYDRRESRLKYLSKTQLTERYTAANIQILDVGKGDLGATVGAMAEGRSLWKLCLILALLFFALEVLLLRLWP